MDGSSADAVTAANVDPILSVVHLESIEMSERNPRMIGMTYRNTLGSNRSRSLSAAIVGGLASNRSVQ